MFGTAAKRRIKRSDMNSIATQYLGLELSGPVIMGSSGLTSTLRHIVEAEEAGAGKTLLTFHTKNEHKGRKSRDRPTKTKRTCPGCLSRSLYATTEGIAGKHRHRKHFGNIGYNSPYGFLYIAGAAMMVQRLSAPLS